MYRNQTNTSLLLKAIIAILILVCICAFLYYEHSVKEELRAQITEAQTVSKAWEDRFRKIDDWHKAQQASVDSLKEWASNVEGHTQDLRDAMPVMWALPICRTHAPVAVSIGKAPAPTFEQNKIFDQFGKEKISE